MSHTHTLTQITFQENKHFEILTYNINIGVYYLLTICVTVIDGYKLNLNFSKCLFFRK